MTQSEEYLFTRHVTAHIKGDVDKDKISVSSPEIMARIEPLFEGYTFASSSAFVELRGRIESLFHFMDPLNIVQKANPGQLDEYLPEADIVIWLYLNKKLHVDTFWALWEYQFADVNPFTDTNDLKLKQLFNEVEKALKN